MDVFGGKRRAREIQAMRGEISDLKAKVEFQALVINDVTTVTERDKKFRGNLYQSYKEAVNAVAEKYEGSADWGVLQTGSIIDTRAAFIAGGGLKVFPKREKKEKGKNGPGSKAMTGDPAQNEMDFVNRFIEFNNLDHEMIQEYAINAEIEGRFLGELFWDKEASMVALRFRSWNDYNYTVQTAPNDYAKYTSVTWADKATGEKKELKPEVFVYGRFAGRVNKPNEPYPKVAKCLTQIEDLDKGLKDWREINRLFAAPKPNLEFESADEAKKANEDANRMNFKIKQMFIHTGKFNYAMPSMEGSVSIQNEIMMKAKIVSGTTGVPVQFLGMPDLTSIRASSSENLEEVISAATQKERTIWKGLYKEAIKKAMAIWNSESQKTKLDANKLSVNIPYITQEHWNRIKEIWMPLEADGVIRHETLLEQLPDIDIDKEVEAKEQRTALALERFKPNSSDEGDEGDEGEEEGEPYGHIQTGKRGGKYRINEAGEKVYVD